MIVVVTGGRNYTDRAAIYAALDQGIDGRLGLCAKLC